MKVSVTIDADDILEELKDAPDKLGRAVSKWLSQGSQLVVGLVQDEIDGKTRRRTGNLVGSVQADVGATSATIGPTVDYAKWVNDGTEPHDIYPRNKKALAFPMAGGVTAVRGNKVFTRFEFGGKTVLRGSVFATHVYHPGTKPTHYMEAAAERAEEPLAILLEDLVEDELRGNAT